MESKTLNLLLADDDIDDCDFFKDALDEMELSVHFNTVGNGVELMDFLKNDQMSQPDLLFLDLNMPKKSGLECLQEIKSSHTLKDIPVVVFSTSLDRAVVDDLYAFGAHYYIQKPGEFKHLKAVIKKAILFFINGQKPVRSEDNFIIHH